jgi:hypothetical protein
MWEKEYVEYGYKATREKLLHSEDSYISYLMEYENHTDEEVRVHTIVRYNH